MNSKQYTIQELTELTGFSRRTIRYYVQEGLLDPPAGRGRGGFYNDSHLGKLRHIKSLQEHGLNLAAITSLLDTGDVSESEYTRNIWIRYEIVPGFEINISRDMEEKEGKKVSEIIRVARALLEENKDNG